MVESIEPVHFGCHSNESLVVALCSYYPSIYIYIYIEKYTNNYIYIYIYIYIHIYIYTHIHTHTHTYFYYHRPQVPYSKHQSPSLSFQDLQGLELMEASLREGSERAGV